MGTNSNLSNPKQKPRTVNKVKTSLYVRPAYLARVSIW
jgi:hypothetical protein